MKAYEIDKPLIVIHVPKTAGTSVRTIFHGWYGDNFHRHYTNTISGELPPKIDLSKMHSIAHPLCLFGHFNKLGGFGVEDYYPEVGQFVTILRDPFEQLISNYFFFKKVAAKMMKNRGVDASTVTKTGLDNFLQETKPNMLNQFPREINFNNYKDICEQFFIEIGITERLDISMRRIAEKLGFEYSGDLPKLNITRRDETIPHNLKGKFMELNQLEYEVYNYCLKKYI